MFIVAIALFSLGYTVLYFGASMARAYKHGGTQGTHQSSDGGIPFGALLGIPIDPSHVQHVQPPFNAHPASNPSGGTGGTGGTGGGDKGGQFGTPIPPVSPEGIKNV